MTNLAATPAFAVDRIRTPQTTGWEVSVVIPAYRAAGTIGRAVRSVLDQTVPPAEILIIDDGSPDDLETAIRPFGDRVRFIRQPNGGPGSARNTGIDHARSDLIAFLDADDYWEPDKLEQHVRLYEKSPYLGLTCSRYYEQEPGGRRREVALDEMPVDCERRLTGGKAFQLACQISTVTVVVPRRLLEHARFSTDLKTAEDRDLWVRLVASAPVYCLSRPLATAVLVPGSLSRSDIDGDCTNMLRVVETHRQLLGNKGRREWEARIYRRWAGVHLAERRPRNALRPAWTFLCRRPWSLSGWWVLLKSGALAVPARRRPAS